MRGRRCDQDDRDDVDPAFAELAVGWKRRTDRPSLNSWRRPRAHAGTFPQDRDAGGPSGSSARRRAPRTRAIPSPFRSPPGRACLSAPSQGQDAETRKAVRTRAQPGRTTAGGNPRSQAGGALRGEGGAGKGPGAV